MKNMIITDKMYREFIENTITTEGWQVADIANKKALELKGISLNQYRMAAQLIAAALLAD